MSNVVEPPPRCARQIPPQLHFDDGSRVIGQSSAIFSEERSDEIKIGNVNNCTIHSSIPQTQGPFPNNACLRGSMSIQEYYEIDRLTREVLRTISKGSRASGLEDGWLCRIALQFPDLLLRDGPEVCWALEHSIRAKTKDDQHHPQKLQPLVFLLGDTTFGSCCPDEVSALHLDADVLIHFGHACLSPTTSLPVLYSFGISNFQIEACVDAVAEQAQQSNNDRILLLYQVQYFHAIEEIKTTIERKGDILVIAGSIPTHDNMIQNHASCESSLRNVNPDQSSGDYFVKIGGLNVPTHLDLSTVAVLYVGDPDNNKQYTNIMLRFISMSNTSPRVIWTWNPNNSTLDTSFPTSVRKQLNRRFYLTQKARDAATFGILVGTLSHKHFASVVSSLQKSILDANRSCYTFAVGKINGAKLANFAEIDCYVLVACGETSILDFERDLHVPVITPLELDIALGYSNWGDSQYTLDYMEYLSHKSTQLGHKDTLLVAEKSTGMNHFQEDNQDVPYFSLVSGTLQDARRITTANTATTVNLLALPGQGQITMYESKGSEFLKQRNYQGLQTQLRETPVCAAVPGQSGIASNYGER